MQQMHARRPVPGALAAVVVTAFAFSDPAAAQSGAGLMLRPFPKEDRIDAWADAHFMDKGSTETGGEDFSLRVYETAGRVRLQPGEVASPRVGWEMVYLDLETDFLELPDRLVDQSVGFALPISHSDGWITALSLGVGYAGDGPFGDGDAWYGKGTLAVFKQPDENSALVFLLDYDGNRPFLPDVPLPGFAYTRRVSEQLFYTIGLPVSSIEWRPDNRWTLSATYSLPYTVDAAVGYELVPGLSLYGKLENRYEAFFLDALEENHDRLLFEQRRAELGVRWEPRDGMTVTVGAGYAWNGEFSVGFDARETDEVTDISDEPYVKAGIQFSF